MGIDAIALLRPKSKFVLRRRARLIVVLPDGSAMFLTGMRYRDAEGHTEAARAHIEATFGCPLAELHDDARGVLIFPDVAEPRSSTYDEVVAEVHGVWVPLDASPKAARAATRAGASRAKALGKRLRDADGVFSTFGARDATSPTLRVTSLDVARLETLAGTVVCAGPDTEVWCLLLRRKTKLPTRALVPLAKGSVVLGDGSLAIHAKYLESLAAVEKRLRGDYAPWLGEHNDARGVPVFRWGVFHRIEGAHSYDDALRRLGQDVRWIGNDLPKARVARRAPAKKTPKATAKKTSKKGSPKRTSM